MGNPISVGYFGSDGVKTSTINKEIIQQHKPTDWNSFKAYKFSFYNDQACTVKINGSTNAIYLRAGQGFEMNEIDNEIWSFVIVEANITYNYIGAY